VLALTAVLHPSPLDARRGVVRLHPEVLAALGIDVWSPVLLTGRRTTAALAARAPASTPAGTLLCDELVLGNLQAASGATVTVAAAPAPAATSVTVRGPSQVMAAVDPALLRGALHGKVLTPGDDVSLLPQDLAPVRPYDVAGVRRSLGARLGPMLQTLLMHVTAASPGGPVLVTSGTVVGWDGGTTTTGDPTPAVVPAEQPGSAPSLADLPGLESQAASLREWLDLGFHHRDLLQRLGASPGMGVLLTGAAGSGKTTLVEAVAAVVGARVQRLWGPALAASDPGAAAERLTAVLQQAAREVPTVVLLQDVDALASPDSPLLPTLLSALRALVSDGRAAVVCTTSSPERCAPDLRVPGTLDHELALPLPDRPQRLRLLEVATRSVPLADDVQLDDVATRTPGFVAADLLSLVREAGLRAAARQRAEAEAQLGRADFDAALEVVRPTSMEGTSLDLGRLTLDDVGDMEDVKDAVTEAVLWPLQYPDTFARLGVAPPRGMLLYGPPGCGKTFLVKAIAGTGQANVLSVKGAELLSKWVGESERAVRELFRRAREASPAIVFLDEVDALAPVRGQATDGGTTDRVVAALLTELDGVEDLRDVSVIGATNRPDLVDPALLRPGRLERLVFAPPPDAAARAQILRAAAKDVPLADDVDVLELGARTDGYSGADCAALVREAALTAMRESMAAATVTAAHVETALGRVRPSLDPAQVAALASYAERREQR
jgi:transitional endoplasmic reticulum ATPase